MRWSGLTNDVTWEAIRHRYILCEVKRCDKWRHMRGNKASLYPVWGEVVWQITSHERQYCIVISCVRWSGLTNDVTWEAIMHRYILCEVKRSDKWRHMRGNTASLYPVWGEAVWHMTSHERQYCIVISCVRWSGLTNYITWEAILHRYILCEVKRSDKWRHMRGNNASLYPVWGEVVWQVMSHERQ